MRAVWWLVPLSGCFVTDAELTEALDRDGDGYLPVEAGGDDCWEGRADVNPGALELCGDGVDNDCDGWTDDDGVGASVFYRDADGDGAGTEESVTACSVPPGYAETDGDCDDTSPDFRPGIEDLCDGLDQNCNGQPDDDGLLILRYRDLDGDQWGDDADTRYACIEEPGWVNEGGDCDEGDPSIHPGVGESCDGIDQDCNGLADDGLPFLTQWRDLDGDGVGDESQVRVGCDVPAGWALTFGDCDDLDASVSPLAVDLCDGVDQDCNGIVDDDAVFSLFFEDADGDGDGSFDGILLEACAPVPGFVLRFGDCDDADPDVSSLALDLCDDRDNDCDGVVDDEAVFRLYFRDADGDGVGVLADPIEACAPPSGYVALYGDCDDTTTAIQPGIDDFCDGIDQDCDGEVDEDAVFDLWFADADGDGLGRTSAPVSTCDGPPPAHVATPGDCDDTSSAVQIPVWYRDQDGDSWGTSVTASACVQPPGFADRSGDCDDTLAAVRPGRAEVCNNDRDDDCDPATRCRYSGLIDVLDLEELVVPSGASVTLIPDVVGSSADDVMLEFADRLELFAGPDPDLMGTPTAAIILPSAFSVARTGHANADSKHDVVLTGGGTVRVYLGGQTGTLPASMTITSGGTTFPHNLAALAGSVWTTDPGANGGLGVVHRFPYQGGTVSSTAWSQSIVGETPGGRFGTIISGANGTLAVSALEGADGSIYLFEDPQQAATSSDAHRIAFAQPGARLVGGLPGQFHPDQGQELACVSFNPDGFNSGGLAIVPMSGNADINAPLQLVLGQPQTFQVIVPALDIDGDGVNEFVSIGEGIDQDAQPVVPALYGSSEPLMTMIDADFYVVLTSPDPNATLSPQAGNLDDDGRADLLVSFEGVSGPEYHVLRGRGE